MTALTSAGVEQVLEVAQQSEPRDISGGVDRFSQRAHRLGGARVERRHHVHGRRHRRLGDQIAFQRGTQDPGAQELRQHERVAHSSTGIGEKMIGMHFTEGHHPVLRFLVVDGMPSKDECAGLSCHIPTASQRVAEQLEHLRVAGPPHEIQGKERRRAHGIDVAKRVGGGDGTKRVRVIDDRCEEIHAGHDRAIVRQPKDRGIITRGRTHQDTTIVGQRHMTQHLRQLSSD